MDGLLIILFIHHPLLTLFSHLSSCYILGRLTSFAYSQYIVCFSSSCFSNLTHSHRYFSSAAILFPQHPSTPFCLNLPLCHSAVSAFILLVISLVVIVFSLIIPEQGLLALLKQLDNTFLVVVFVVVYLVSSLPTVKSRESCCRIFLLGI